MKRRYYTPATLLLATLGACSHMESAPPASPAQPPGAVQTPSAAAPSPVEPKPEPSNRELEEESQRLLSMQKNYFNIFRIDEANIGLTPRTDAIGVFDLQKSPRGERIRLTVSLQPKKPMRLSVGTYMVMLDTVVDYIEVQVCQSSSCAGKRKRIVRSLPKVLQVQISPQNQYFGGKDFSLAEMTNAEGKDKSYKSLYQDVVITVKRISVTPGPT